MTQFIRQYLLAVQFFTRIPITGRLADWVGFSPELLRASAAHKDCHCVLLPQATMRCPSAHLKVSYGIMMPPAEVPMRPGPFPV